MNSEAKRVWTEALRSGHYLQNKYSLRKNGKFCCLGVLCDIAPAGLGEWDESVKDQPVAFQAAQEQIVNRAKEFPPQEVLDWAGLTVIKASDLAHLNDDEGASFEAIAKYIEDHL